MKTFTILALCVLFLTLVTTPSSADSWTPSNPFSTVSTDGERIFFFTPPRPEWVSAEPWENALPTGMYTNTSPPQLIYTIDFGTYDLWERDFVFSDCMSYFAFFPMINSLNGAEAVAFYVYANGVLQQTIMVADVIERRESLRPSVSMTPWVYRNTIAFDSETNIVTFTTKENVTFKFNIAYEEEILDVNLDCDTDVICDTVKYSTDVNCVTGCLPNSLSTHTIAIFIVTAIGLIIACYLIYKQINNKRKGLQT